MSASVHAAGVDTLILYTHVSGSSTFSTMFSACHGHAHISPNTLRAASSYRCDGLSRTAWVHRAPRGGTLRAGAGAGAALLPRTPATPSRRDSQGRGRVRAVTPHSSDTITLRAGPFQHDWPFSNFMCLWSVPSHEVKVPRLVHEPPSCCSTLSKPQNLYVYLGHHHTTSII